MPMPPRDADPDPPLAGRAAGDASLERATRRGISTLVLAGDDEGRAVAASLGLDRPGFSRACAAGEVVARSSTREVRTVMAGAPPRAMFLKISRRPLDAREALDALLEGRRPAAPMLHEWRMANALRSAGIGTARPVAAGEERLLGIPVASFYLCEALDADLLADALRRAGGDLAARRALLLALGDLARRLHAAGFTNPDLKWKHIYVERGPGPPRLAMIDFHRVRRLPGVPDRLVARDLGALDATTPADLASPRDRLRVVARALGSPGPDGRERARRILALVARRVARIRRWRLSKAGRAEVR